MLVPELFWPKPSLKLQPWADTQHGKFLPTSIQHEIHISVHFIYIKYQKNPQNQNHISGTRVPFFFLNVKTMSATSLHTCENKYHTAFQLCDQAVAC